MKQSIINYRTGILLNRKHAIRIMISTSLRSFPCGEPDSVLHILLRCKKATMSNVVTERQDPSYRCQQKPSWGRRVPSDGARRGVQTVTQRI
eukprot:1157960-Pelagomonas_calceolata.AAC.11